MKRKFLFCGAFLAFALAYGTVTRVSADGEESRVLIGFKQKPDATAKGLVYQYGGEIKYAYHIIPAIAATVPENVIKQLRADPNVRYVEEDGIIKAIGETLPWGIDRIDAELVHPYNKGTGVKIGIIDTGIDLDHPDLAVKADVTFVAGTTSGDDDNGHGTHCAGVVAALDNDIGVIGVAPEAYLYAIKVLDSNGSGYLSDVVAGIQWAIDNGIEVISMSLGTSSNYQSMQDACDAAYANDIVVIAAAGNAGNRSGRGDNISYPGKYSSVIAVGATKSDDSRANFSSTGPDLELMAPGVDIYSTWKNSDYNTISGTSMACPHVTGTAALVKVAYPAFTNVDIRNQLKNTADDLGAAGFDTKYGYGLVDADEAAPSTGPPDTIPPAQVTGVTVTTVSSSQLDLSWTANTEQDLHHYNIYRSTSSGGPYDLIGSPTTNSYSDNGLTASTTYYYTVSAVDVSGNEGLVSDEAFGTTSEGPSNIMYAENIIFDGAKKGKNLFLYTYVKVVDGSGNPLGDANVNMTLTNGASTWNYSGTTGSDGTVKFRLSKAKPGTYTATVTDLTHSTYAWDKSKGVTSASCTLNSDGTISGATAHSNSVSFGLADICPNPCIRVANISYSIGKQSAVTLKIYNVQGQVIRTLVSNVMNPGNYTTHWDGKDEGGNKVSYGIYFYQIQTSNYLCNKKLILVK